MDDVCPDDKTEETKLPAAASTNVSQYSSSVIDYSSEYGGSIGGAYGIQNILGPPTRFEDGEGQYGDHTSSLVFRTYGKYWNMLPYHRKFKPIGFQPDWFKVTDYVDVEIELSVFPTKIELFETFCPGGLVRILISDYKTEIPEGTPHLASWKTIWSGKGYKLKGDHVYTIASPTLPKLNTNSMATRRIRLEFNDSEALYYHESEAIRVHGKIWSPGKKASEYLVSKIKSSVSISVPTKMLKNLSLDKKKIKKKTSPPVEEIPEASLPSISPNNVNYFEMLPLEMVLKVFNYIRDLKHQAQLKRVCKSFQRILDDNVNEELNLKPFYTIIKGKDLSKILTPYGNNLIKLDLSWIGSDFKQISSLSLADVFQSLINLEELKCRNCQSFLDDVFLKAVAANCKKLKLLDLFHNNVIHLHLLAPLVNLEYLDISQCQKILLSPDGFNSNNSGPFFKSCTMLRWLLMGRNSSMFFSPECVENIMLDLIDNCKALQGVNFWRQQGITRHFDSFIKTFGKSLEYLDVGWSSVAQDRNSGRLWRLLQDNCPNMKCLCLTAVRLRLTDDQLGGFGKKCPKMEQLDLLGARGFSYSGLDALLTDCKHMVLLDISYGDCMSATVHAIQEKYPACDIKNVPDILTLY